METVNIEACEACEPMTRLLCDKYTIVSLEVLGMDLHVLDSGRDGHHYTLPCLHSLSMRCHSVLAVPFASPWLCILRRTAHSTFSPLAQSLSFTLHFPPICFHLAALSFSAPLLPLSLSPHCQFPYRRFLSHSVSLSPFASPLSDIGQGRQCRSAAQACFTDLV